MRAGVQLHGTEVKPLEDVKLLTHSSGHKATCWAQLRVAPGLTNAWPSELAYLGAAYESRGGSSRRPIEAAYERSSQWRRNRIGGARGGRAPAVLRADCG